MGIHSAYPCLPVLINEISRKRHGGPAAPSMTTSFRRLLPTMPRPGGPACRKQTGQLGLPSDSSYGGSAIRRFLTTDSRRWRVACFAPVPMSTAASAVLIGARRDTRGRVWFPRRSDPPPWPPVTPQSHPPRAPWRLEIFCSRGSLDSSAVTPTLQENVAAPSPAPKRRAIRTRSWSGGRPRTPPERSTASLRFEVRRRDLRCGSTSARCRCHFFRRQKTLTKTGAFSGENTVTGWRAGLW
jgi:hypothetical protein